MIARFRALRDERPEIFAGKKVLLRLDLNLPLDLTRGKPLDDFRLRRSLPTLNFLREVGAKLVVASHLSDAASSLKPIAEYLKNNFCPEAEVLENLRNAPGEEKNDPEFAKRLAAQGDIFVNDAFSVSHRRHASIVSVPKLLPSYAGLLFEEEVKNLSRLFAPSRPFVVVLGGRKFGTKLPLIQNLLKIADRIFIGGALAHSFFKELGYEIGRSMIDEETEFGRPFLTEPKIILPRRVLVRQANDRIAEKQADALLPDDKIIDAAGEFLEKIEAVLAQAKTALWNGPLGMFEDGQAPATAKLAELISRSNVFSVVGGGDSVAAVSGLGLLDKFSFVSTGGGAMLEFLATGTLPGIEALV